MKMTKMTLTRKHSPYFIERDVETNAKRRHSLQAQVSPEVYNDFMKYSRNSDLNKSQALTEVVLNFLNNNVFEQKFFRNLNAILLLPKTCNPDELNEKAHVIGFIDGDEWLEITLLNIFHGGNIDYPLRYNFMYTLKEFNEYNYKNFLHYFNKLYGYDENIFFDIDKKAQQDFDKVKARLSVLYEEIDIDDAYFVMFSFNNYLDVLRDGVYRSKSSALEHDGVIVLFEDILKGVFVRINWSYVENDFSFSLQFEDVNDFDSMIAPDLSNIEIFHDFRKRTQIVSNPEGKLQLKRKQIVSENAYLKKELEKIMSQIEDNEQALKDIDEEIYHLEKYTD